MAVMEPIKKTVGTANAWTASHRTVKMGYVIDFFVVMILSKKGDSEGVYC